MSKIGLLKLSILTVMLFGSTGNVFSQTWVHLNNIGANITGTSSSAAPVSEALCLSVNNKLYVLGSTTYTGSTPAAKIWEYDPTLDGWAEKSTYPGAAKSLFCGFTIGGMIYAGCGTAGSVHATSDFFKYDPATNTWTQVASVPVARIWATGFSIGTKGYVTGGEGTTMGSYLGDLWEYDPAANNWTQKADFPGVTRALPSSFSSGQNGYVGLGFSNNVWHNDFYKYNPATNTWTAINSFPGTGRCGAGCVSIGATAIIMCGNTGMTTYNDCYAYDMTSDNWSTFTSFTGSSRSVILCGAVGNKIFAGGGSAAGGSTVNNDWWSVQTTVGLKKNLNDEIPVFIYRKSRNEFGLKCNRHEIEGEIYYVFDSLGRLVQTGVIAESESRIFAEIPDVYSIVFKSPNFPALRFVND